MVEEAAPISTASPIRDQGQSASVHPQAEARGPAGLEHRAGLLGVEGTRLAEDVIECANGAQAASISPQTSST